MSKIRIAIDIGSTVVKIAKIGSNDEIIEQNFYPRDFETGIAKQVESLVDSLDTPHDKNSIQVCSSANGGLRIGIICLTNHFSGTTFRNQVLSAGANPIFVHDMEEDRGNLNPIDILLIGGGIDCEDSPPLEKRLRRFNPDKYHFSSLIYAGNCFYADLFTQLFPDAKVIANPLAEALNSRKSTVFEALRHAYLDDLVFKDGVSELRDSLPKTIHPTPEIVNRGFQRAVFNHSTILITGACVLIDIGGATTDIHYTVEIISTNSESRPSAGTSIARYVFTDLGIVASIDSTILQLRTHPRLYEFLNIILKENIREIYRSLREGEYDPSLEILSYACLFLALDRFSQGQGAGLPIAELGKVSQFILTGGSAQNLNEKMISKIVNLFLENENSHPTVFIDRCYQIWVDGITWPYSPAHTV